MSMRFKKVFLVCFFPILKVVSVSVKFVILVEVGLISTKNIKWLSNKSLFCFEKPIKSELVGFLKHTKAVKYRIVCYNDCKDDSYSC